MLHVRRASFIPRRSLRPAFTEIADWLGAADPGLARLKLALRGTLSVTLATTAAILVARAVGVTPVEFANGIVLSFMGPFLMREPTQRQRQRTLVVLLVPAAAATILTTLLHGYGPAGDSMFLALVFVCFLIQPHSPRMIGVGLVAVVQTYVGLYLELPPAALPLQLLSILAAAPIVALACFVVFPIRPAATLRRTVHAVQWRAARVLRSSLAPADPAVLRRDLSRLNEAALAADDLLALLDPAGRSEVRAGLIEVELATARMINAARAHKPGPRHAMRLRLHERRMRAGRRYIMDPASFEAGSLRASLLDLGHAAHRLGVASSLIRPTTQALPAPPAPPGPLAWRFAARVTLAAGIAMAAGMAISPQRWFWAVITVYVVFLNARSRGDTIYKGLQRLAGTLFGIASGLALALLVSGDPVIEAICLLLSVFGMFYLFLLSYTAGIFCVTVLLGLLYGMLGASLETVLVLRFEETAIGAMAAIFVAVLVLPVRTRGPGAAIRAPGADGNGRGGRGVPGRLGRRAIGLAAGGDAPGGPASGRSTHGAGAVHGGAAVHAPEPGRSAVGGPAGMCALGARVGGAKQRGAAKPGRGGAGGQGYAELACVGHRAAADIGRLVAGRPIFVRPASCPGDGRVHRRGWFGRDVGLA